jgi:hypothetical protein
MLQLGAKDLLAIWEEGQARHAIDRALLLFAAARPELPADRLTDLPLGQRNEALLRLRQRTFGPRISAHVDCPGCGDRMELALQTDALLANTAPPDAAAEFETDGIRFRPVTSRDLVAALSHADAESAAIQLLERCCVARPDKVSLHDLHDKVEAGLESLDPNANIELSLTCEACRHAWTAPFDIGAVLWDEVDARARALLAEVHALARAYGWHERDILGLSEQRRAAYLRMVAA